MYSLRVRVAYWPILVAQVDSDPSCSALLGAKGVRGVEYKDNAAFFSKAIL